MTELTKEQKIEKYLLERELIKRKCERSFYEFVLISHKLLHPEVDLITNWHIKYTCDFTQKLIEDMIAGVKKEKDLIVNIPPRSLKSFIFSVALPAWMWIKKPSLKYIGSSYAEALSLDLSVDCRRLINDPFFQELWGDKIELSGDQNTKTCFENTARGSRRCTSTGGSITGEGADVIVVDDPINPKMAHSDTERKTALDFFNHTLSTRLNNPATGLFIVVMQRLHEDDLSGYLLEKNSSGYHHLCFPAELSDDVSPKEMQSFYKDGLFFPTRFTKEYLTKIKSQLGSYQYAGQFLQKSSPAEGGLLKRNHWQRYDPATFIKFDRKILSVDCTFKGNDTSDYVVAQVWGQVGINKYLIKQYRGQWDFRQTAKIIQIATHQHNPNGVYIEDKANGTAIIEVLKQTIPGIIPVTPKESKFARAAAIQPQLESGNIYVPIDEAWVDDFIEECANFPNAKHDDQVDAMTQAIYLLTKNSCNNIRIIQF